jgi:hypothetical protein
VRPIIEKIFCFVKVFSALSFIGGDPIAQSAGQMERREAVDAFSGAAILKVKV